MLPLVYFLSIDIGSHLCNVLMNTAYTSFGEDFDF